MMSPELVKATCAYRKSLFVVLIMWLGKFILLSVTSSF